MKALIQLVKNASVKVDQKIISEINYGFLVFLGIKNTDTEENLRKLADKLIKLRIFPDENDKMNLSIKDKNAEVLVVSQFTLYADTIGGNRPSFSAAMRPEEANLLYEKFCDYLETFGITVKRGQFQAMMEVELINDGPVTVMIEN